MIEFAAFNGRPQYCDLCGLPHQHGLYVTRQDGHAIIHSICPRCMDRINSLRMRVAYQGLMTTPQEWGWYADWLEGQLEYKRFSEVGAVIAEQIAEARRNAKP